MKIRSSSGFGAGLLAIGLVISIPASAQILWNFDGGTGASSNTQANLTASALTAGNLAGGDLTFNSTSFSTGYTGASAGPNAGVRTVTAASLSTATSTYFEFTITPAAGFQVQATGLSFGSRSTATGPTAVALYSSLDGYSTALASSAVTTSWTSITLSGLSVTGGTGSDVTFRLYGAPSSTSSQANWRIDDLSLSVSATSAIPEPASYACFVGIVSLGAVLLIRRRGK